MNALRTALAFGLAVVAGGVARAQETTRVSVDSSGVQGNGDSYSSSISADGQVVVFESIASSLVPGDTNGYWDVFVHDRSTGLTERVSVDSSGAQGNDLSGLPSISSDGRVVAFESAASNLVVGDTNGTWDVFVHDRSTGLTERLSVDSSGVQGNDVSYLPSISADGQVVAFQSYASNLVAGDTNGTIDIFVHDRATGLTERVSVDSSGVEGNDYSEYLSISSDGQIVAFGSYASNLVAGDTNGTVDAFVHDRTTGLTERVSVDSSGIQGNNGSGTPSISADGQIVAFGSAASNLVAGDTNGYSDVFVHDRVTGITERVSADSSATEANSDSGDPSISADGQVVAFDSSASNLVAGDTNGFDDVFIHDRSTGSTRRSSVDSSGVQGNYESNSPSISADGHVVTFSSGASNLVAGDTYWFSDVFVHELCSTPASWSNYGAGFPGTNGVPGFSAGSNPVFGTSLTLDLANSYGRFTAGLVFVGFQQTSIHSGWGGDLVVVPSLTIAIGIPTGGASLTGTIPGDENLCGFELDLQAIEADPGAAKGVSFTQGLELILGH